MSGTVRKSLLFVPALLGATVFASAASAAQLSEQAASTQNSSKATQAQATAVAAPEKIELPTTAAKQVAAPTLVAATPAEASGSASSAAQIQAYGSEGRQTDEADQVTSVSQLSDVRPTDWAFQALQSLVERYGCIVGYPDRTYRGNQALTRYEFAAGLNACIDRVNELIAAGTADLVKKEDLDILRRLQEEFSAELATLRGRVDALEARTATLEKQQFSTTTKLNGEVIFSVADTFGDAATRTRATATGRTAASRDDNTNTVFSDRVRLALDTSFTGRDRLRTRLQARNTVPFNGALTGTNMTRLAYDGDEGNAVQVDKLYYRFPLGDNLQVQVDAVNLEFYDGLISSLSPLESSGLGSISRLGRFNPILRVNNPKVNGGSAGITAAYRFSPNLRFEAGFSSDRDSNNPSNKNGLFNGGVTGIAQLVYDSRNLTLGLLYAYNYSPSNDVDITGGTGSGLASRPFGNVATRTHSVGGSVQFKFSPKFIIGGWGGAQFATNKLNDDNATSVNAAVYAAFPDLGKRGNLGALLVALPPKVTSSDAREDRNTSFQVEALYRYRINDNIAITPGVFVIFNPEHDNRNDTQFVGVVRTTFTF